MPTNKTRIEIRLTRANSAMARQAARILKIPVAKVVSLCLEGSTNPQKKTA